jgi:lysophospholipase L1-like esterase
VEAPMHRSSVPWFRSLLVVTAVLASPALANTITQNTSWTITRSGTTAKYRVVAYGDSIYAGYTGSLSSVSKRAGPLVDGEYLGKKWNANIEVIRRAKSGARADDIYNNKIIGDRSYMQNTSTRVVQFEMCGNDYLQARSSLNGQSGTCNYGVLDTALANCTTYMERAMQAINTYATTAKVKVIMNLYYPGYAADNTLLACTDAATGTRLNKQSKFIPYIARSNWRACNLAERYGFKCADMFAEWMGADYDSNGDGQVDSAALRYVSGESEAAYVQRISVTLRSTIRDANTHFTSSSTSYDYLLSDDTHPTYYGGTIGVSFWTGNGSGSGAADFTDAQTVGGKNPVWNTRGHERMGWASSLFDPATP